ncbi:MAG: EAL domain-containing protein, partial [Gammaproteobacteria bacterium]
MQLAAFIPQLDAGEVRTGSLADILARNADLLNLEWDLQVLALYDKGGQMLGSWSSERVPPSANRWVATAAKTLEPVTEIDCRVGCLQYLAVPTMNPTADEERILLLGHSIASAVISFSRAAGADIAIVRSTRSASITGVPAQFLAPWRAQVLAVSHPRQTMPIIKTLASHYSAEGLRSHPVIFRHDGRWYQAALDQPPKHDVFYLLISDISPHMTEIQKTRLFILLLSVGGFLLAALLLLWYLGRPLSRLHHLIEALPAIGEHRHHEAKKLLQEATPSGLRRDEIDLLNESVGRLNDELKAAEQARARAEEHLAWLADHDPLTGLFNRRRFQAEFNRTLRQSLRHGRGGAILYFDLDDFKAINDLCGHPAGDKLLRDIAVTVQQAIRSTDLLARLGGDEFAILVPECKENEAIILAEKLLDAVARLEFSFEGQSHPVSCSIGIALFPQHGEDIETLLANADISMYQAKHTGQGHWHLFTREEEYREVLSLRSQWRKRIAEALHDDLFVLHYQPIVDTNARDIAWYEALIRMRDGDDLIYPDRFIPVAERTGQIREIDRWVIRRAIQQLAAHPALVLSVNLSGKVIDDPDLLGFITSALARHEVKAERLIFEITETQAVENTGAAVDLIRRVTELGCRFALDDFGSGFASYQYLKELPVDLVKIDGTFIRNMAMD